MYTNNSSNPWFDKERRKIRALTQYKDMDILHYCDTRYSTENSDIQDKDIPIIISEENKTDKMEIEVRNVDTVTAIVDANKDEDNKVCALNFASYKNPGGKFLEGSMAQEEALCHQSNLYNVLVNFQDNFYDPNKKMLNKGLYNSNLIYSPDIVFIDDNGTHARADIITCAAPNKKTVIRYGNKTEKEVDDAMDDRIQKVLYAGYTHDVDHLILGAFGCGVFGNDPEKVSSSFKEELDGEFKNKFKKVTFAIPGGKNFEVFKNTFSDSL